MNETSLRGSARLVGGLAVLIPVVMGVSFGLLSLTFHYPSVMNRPAAEVLRTVHDAGAGVRVYWAGVMLAACALLGLSVGLPTIMAPERERSVHLMVAAAGAVAAVMMIVDVGQWVWLYPNLADRWATAGPALRQALEQDWLNYHQLLGEGIGRYLASLFSAIWAAGVGALMLMNPQCPRWLGWAGLSAGLLFLVSALPGLGFNAWGDVNTAGFGIWFVWLIATGLLLVGVPRPLRA